MDTKDLFTSSTAGPEPAEAPLSGWRRAKLLLQVIEIRLRFIVILVGTGLVIGYWDTLQNHWDRWSRPRSGAPVRVEPDTEFYCPMHPWIARASSDPNGAVPKCPICGMSLSTRKRGTTPELPANVTGRVQLSPDRIRLGGLKTHALAYRPLVRQIVTSGSVLYDESRLARIVTRVSGYVEKLLVDTTFEQIELGQPMVELYSPELVSTVRELLLARKSSPQLDLAAPARRKLELLGVSSGEIEEVLRAGQSGHRLLIRSPRAGHVIQKNVVQGARVEAGQTLFDVADLTKVWIEADVYEKDIALLHPGQLVEATVEALPGRVFRGTVALVHPALHAETRTSAVRIAVINEGHLLRPGMVASVRLSVPLVSAGATPVSSRSGRHPSWTCPMHPEVVSTDSRRACPRCGMKLVLQHEEKGAAGEVLAVPEIAVIDTGTRRIVYVERAEGVYEGVAVELGGRVGEYYPVLSGLRAGDRVVTRGAFLVDAETRLNPAAGAAYSGAGGGPSVGGKGSGEAR